MNRDDTAASGPDRRVQEAEQAERERLTEALRAVLPDPEDIASRGAAYRAVFKVARNGQE